MKYEDLVTYISDHTETPKYVVRKVLRGFPDVIRSCLEQGETVITPLGTFESKLYKGRVSNLPGGKGGEIPPYIKVRLKPGKTMTIRDSDPEWEQVTGQSGE